jgi:hypothetical protein
MFLVPTREFQRHNDRVDSLLEYATKQAVMTVAQWHRNQIIRGLWLLAIKKLKMDSCLREKLMDDGRKVMAKAHVAFGKVS